MDDINESKNALITVIVPVYNGESFLHASLDAILNSNYPRFEVLVVDDGSTDMSASIARNKGITVLRTASPRSGPANARNLAADQAKGEILLFVDADVVIKRDTISKVVADFQRDPEIAALFGSYDDKPGDPGFLSQYKNLCHHFVHQNSNPEASTFWAGLGAVRRQIFLDIGGFDCAKFAIPSIEDIELGTRLRQAGQRILLDREIQVKHLKKWTFLSLLKTDIFCRAVPWSKLLLTSNGMINDMNLKTADRASAVFVAMSIATLPFLVWKPMIALLLPVFLIAILLLSWKLFRFFAEKRGVLFAAGAYPLQLLYFFYSGVTFAVCWFYFALPKMLGQRKHEVISDSRPIS
jgi:glycosyltransferase involved in cell wall biosynthesis